MRVALNLSNLRGYGSRQVGRGIRKGLRAASVDVVHAWLPRGEAEDAEPATQVRPGALAKVLADNLAVPRGLRAVGATHLFSLGDTGPVRPGVPHLLLVQQAFLTYALDELDFYVPPAFRAKIALLQAYFRAGLKGVSQLTVQTEDMKRRVIAHWGLAPERISVVPSSVDDHVLAFAGARIPASEEPYFCYLASPGPHKNHVLLASLMAALRPSFPEIRCHLTVEARAVPELVEAAARAQVEDAFVYRGPLGRVESLKLLAGARAAVIPSKLESFGIPYYEALALGVPILAADRPFAREACGDAALYAAPDSGLRWAEHAARLLGSETERSRLGEAARQRHLEVHRSWEDIGRQYAALLEGMG